MKNNTENNPHPMQDEDIAQENPFVQKLDMESEESSSYWKIIRTRIITGFFVVVPLVLSLWLVLLLYSRMTQWGVRATEKYIPEIHTRLGIFWMEQGIRVLNLILVLAALFFVGMLTRLAIGKKLLSIVQKIFLKLPLVNIIYSTCKQIGDALWSQKGGNMFRQVVLFEYPMKDTYAIGFITNENHKDFEVSKTLNQDMISVFMPTTPNPTTGFLMFIPREKCRVLEMSVADAMRLIVSCGAIIPNPNALPDNTGEQTLPPAASSGK